VEESRFYTLAEGIMISVRGLQRSQLNGFKVYIFLSASLDESI